MAGPLPSGLWKDTQYKQDKRTDLVNDPGAYSEDPAYCSETSPKFNNSLFKNKKACPKSPLH